MNYLLLRLQNIGSCIKLKDYHPSQKTITTIEKSNTKKKFKLTIEPNNKNECELREEIKVTKLSSFSPIPVIPVIPVIPNHFAIEMLLILASSRVNEKNLNMHLWLHSQLNHLYVENISIVKLTSTQLFSSIFSFLSFEDLFYKVILTCRQWCRIILLPSTIRNLHFKIDKIRQMKLIQNLIRPEENLVLQNLELKLPESYQKSLKKHLDIFLLSCKQTLKYLTLSEIYGSGSKPHLKILTSVKNLRVRNIKNLDSIPPNIEKLDLENSNFEKGIKIPSQIKSLILNRSTPLPFHHLYSQMSSSLEYLSLTLLTPKTFFPVQLIKEKMMTFSSAAAATEIKSNSKSKFANDESKKFSPLSSLKECKIFNCLQEHNSSSYNDDEILPELEIFLCLGSQLKTLTFDLIYFVHYEDNMKVMNDSEIISNYQKFISLIDSINHQHWPQLQTLRLDRVTKSLLHFWNLLFGKWYPSLNTIILNMIFLKDLDSIISEMNNFRLTNKYKILNIHLNLWSDDQKHINQIIHDKWNSIKFSKYQVLITIIVPISISKDKNKNNNDDDDNTTTNRSKHKNKREHENKIDIDFDFTDKEVIDNILLENCSLFSPVAITFHPLNFPKPKIEYNDKTERVIQGRFYPIKSIYNLMKHNKNDEFATLQLNFN